MNPFPPEITDIHTHTPGRSDAILSVDPTDCSKPPVTPFSVGVHPWSPWPGEEVLERLGRLAADRMALAIGEAGIDFRRSPMTRAQQLELLRIHAQLSERLAKPLVLHVVGGWNEVMALRRELRPSQPWIIHGFRGKPELARRLLAAGFCLSFGERYNPASFELTPAGRRFRESD